MQIIFVTNLEKISNQVETSISQLDFGLEERTLDGDLEFIQFVKKSPLKYENGDEFSLTYNGISQDYKVVYLSSLSEKN